MSKMTNRKKGAKTTKQTPSHKTRGHLTKDLGKTPFRGSFDGKSTKYPEKVTLSVDTAGYSKGKESFSYTRNVGRKVNQSGMMPKSKVNEVFGLKKPRGGSKAKGKK